MATNHNETSLEMPETINTGITLGVIPLLWGLLWLCSHSDLQWAVLAAWAFALFNNTPFSLMHEAVHGIFSKSKLRNECFGVINGMVFLTSFTLQRIAHLGHHRRNRTDREIYDYYLPHQSKLLRNIHLYGGNLFGLYWFCIPISNLIYLLAPWLYTSRFFIEGPARILDFEPYVEEIARHSKLRIWLECLATFSYHGFVWWLLDLNWQGWLLCYWAFALHWSALQYVDHAWSPRDIINGAWNLKVSKPARLIALNYHYHLNHHRYPEVPWTQLPKLTDPAAPQPSFWKIYLSLWGGVKPAPPMQSAKT